MRRRETVEPAGQVPQRLRRFARGDWPAGLDVMAAYRMYRRERRAWAVAHGYLVDVPFGQEPRRDWWAFLAACRGDANGPPPRG